VAPGWPGRLASSTTMDAAQISPSTVNGSSRAVTPVSPWGRTSSYVGSVDGFIDLPLQRGDLGQRRGGSEYAHWLCPIRAQASAVLSGLILALGRCWRLHEKPDQPRERRREDREHDVGRRGLVR